MKTKYILIIAMMLLCSCSIYIYPGVKEIDKDILKSGLDELAYDIIDNPDKLINFKDNYPQFYDSSIVFSYLSNKEILNNMIANIKEYRRSRIFGYHEAFDICQELEIKEMVRNKKLKFDPAKETILMFRLAGCKENLIIYFIKRGNKYCVLDVVYAAIFNID